MPRAVVGTSQAKLRDCVGPHNEPVGPFVYDTRPDQGRFFRDGFSKDSFFGTRFGPRLLVAGDRRDAMAVRGLYTRHVREALRQPIALGSDLVLVLLFLSLFGALLMVGQQMATPFHEQVRDRSLVLVASQIHPFEPGPRVCRLFSVAGFSRSSTAPMPPTTGGPKPS